MFITHSKNNSIYQLDTDCAVLLKLVAFLDDVGHLEQASTALLSSHRLVAFFESDKLP
jgi:hypothetical protein